LQARHLDTLPRVVGNQNGLLIQPAYFAQPVLLKTHQNHIGSAQMVWVGMLSK